MLLTKEEYQAIRKTPGYVYYLIIIKENSSLTLLDVKQAVEQAFQNKLPENWTKIHGRQEWICKPRQIAQYFAFRFTPEKPKAIADYFGRNHRSVVYASARLVEDRILQNTKDKYYPIIKRIFSALNNLNNE